MSVKYIVREKRMLNEFVLNIFKAIARKKGKKLARKLRNDPEMVQILKRADNIADDIFTHIEKKRKEDPEYKKANDFFNTFLKM
jgi:hypothetical protein